MKSQPLGVVLKHFLAFSAAIIVSNIVVPARAQLQITEFMYDPNSASDSIYEWVEVRNTGATDIDLDGAYMDDLLGTAQPPSYSPVIKSVSSGGWSNQTVVPAGGVAVIYDAYLSSGSPANYNDQLFRDSWGLAPSVPVIAGDFFPGLSNSSSGATIDGMGIWANYTDYSMDVDTGTNTVTSYAHALAGQNYQTVSPWPTPAAGHSIQWKGSGDPSNGANWVLSQDGVNGATTNAQITIPGANLNSTSDVANPSFLPGGTPPSKLNITEIMYNPRSTEPGWEWVEVSNNTGQTIDFSQTPYVLDDIAGANLTAPNITSGSIPDGGVAVLFDTDSQGLTIQNMKDAWGSPINFIPVSGFPALNNGTPPPNGDGTGDTFGIWSSLADYNIDSSGATRAFDNTAASVAYDNGANGWPLSDGNGSIYLTDLGADPNIGSNWILSSDSDGLSYHPEQVSGTVVVDPGGEVGSPGSFSAVAVGLLGDFNDDGKVDAADYVIWRKNDTANATLPNDNGATDQATRYSLWRSNFGMSSSGSGSSIGTAAAVPEPMSLALALLGLTAVCSVRRRG
jgi:Lamin Tail Domain